MSRCGRTQQLEEVIRRQGLAAAEHELRTHAQSCAVCRNELSWQLAESALFRQRAAREEVAQMWQAQTQPSAKRGVLGQVVLAASVAAGLLMLVRSQPPAPQSTPEVLESEQLMTPALFFGEENPNCSKLPSGMGFHCSAPVPASFIASR